MANQILNDPSASVNAATYAGQARPDKGDSDVWAAAIGRTGVVSGCSVGQHSVTSVPTFRASSYASAFVGVGPNTVTVTIPAAVAVGDLMLLAVSSGNSAISTTPPTGWTFVVQCSNTHNMTVFSKIAVPGDTGGAATVSVSNTVGTQAAANLVAYVGASAVNASSSVYNNSGLTTQANPAVTPTVANTLVVELWGSNGTGHTNPATSRGSVNASGGGYTASVSDQVGPASGVASTPVTCTAAFGAAWWVATVALTPVAPVANMSVDIGSGSVLINGLPVAVSALAGLALAAADATNPRLDVVSVDSTGVPIVTTGAAAATPNWPAIASLAAGTAVGLAVVYVPATATSILTANIVDKREIFGVIHTNATRLFLDQAPTRRGLYPGLIGSPQNPRSFGYADRTSARSTNR